MDNLDPKMISVVWDILKSLGGGLFAAALFLVKLGRDRTKANEEMSEKINDTLDGFKDEVKAELDKQAERIAKVEDRAVEEAQWRARIEERLKHMPSKDDLGELNATLAGISEKIGGMETQVSAINETLMNEREDLTKMVAAETMKSRK